MLVMVRAGGERDIRRRHSLAGELLERLRCFREERRRLKGDICARGLVLGVSAVSCNFGFTHRMRHLNITRV